MAKIKRILFYVILLMPLVFNPWGDAFVNEISKQFWLMFIVGLLLLFYFYDRPKKLFFSKEAGWFLLFWIFSFLISTIFSFSPVESFFGEYQRLQGFLSSLYYAIFALLAMQFLQKSNEREIGLNIIVVTGVLASIIAILQYLAVPIFGVYEKFVGRSFATMDFPTSLGQFLIFPIMVAAILLLKGDLKYKSRLVFFSALILNFLALLTTANRASILGIFASFGLYALLSLKKLYQKLLLLLVGAGTILGGFLLLNPDLRSISSRGVIWQKSWGLINEYIFFGSGPETFDLRFQSVISSDLYNFERFTETLDRAHNIFIETFVTRGLLGLLVLIFLICAVCFLFFKKGFDQKNYHLNIAFFSLLAYLVSVQFSFSLATHVILVILMLVIFAFNTLKFSNINIDLSRYKKVVVAMGLLFFGIFSIIFSSRLLLADVLLKKGVDEYLFKKDDSYFNLREAVETGFFYAYPYQVLFTLFMEATGDNIHKYALITNKNYDYFLKYGIYLANVGNIEAANENFRKASGLAPNWPVIDLEWGAALFLAEKYADAVSVYENMLRKMPDTWKMKLDLKSKSFNEKEKYRLFRKHGQSFYEALTMLWKSYIKLGKFDKAQELERYL